eukprot:4694044-Pleurochrysis_carterae.AAC.1
MHLVIRSSCSHRAGLRTRSTLFKWRASETRFSLHSHLDMSDALCTMPRFASSTSQHPDQNHDCLFVYP